MPREHEHEIMDNSKGKAIGKVWWNPDKEEIEGSNEAALSAVFHDTSGVKHKDDFTLISKLSKYFKGGYVTARRVK